MITVVLGRRGCGKTTLIQGLIESKPRLLVFDTLAEYGSSGTVFRESAPFVRFVESRQFAQFRVVYQPVNSDSLDEPFSDFLRVAWIVGQVTIVCDEIDSVSKPSSVPAQLARNIRYGRHRGVSVIAASRRAADVPRLLTSQADELISFNQTEPRDIDYIEDFAGKEMAQRTARLPKFEALVYRVFDQTISKRSSRDPKETLLFTRGGQSVVRKKEATPPKDTEPSIDPHPENEEESAPEEIA
jgi:hypothetical protein